MGRAQRDADAESYLRDALPQLGRIAGGITGNRLDAEDLVQDTAAKVILKWRQVRDSDNPDAYVRRLMMNLWLSQRRRRSSTEVVSDDAVSWASPALVGHQERVASHVTLLSQLADLPERQRAVLVLRYLEDRPDAEIAEILQTSTGAVAAAASRGLRALRDRLPATEQPRGAL